MPFLNILKKLDFQKLQIETHPISWKLSGFFLLSHIILKMLLLRGTAGAGMASGGEGLVACVIDLRGHGEHPLPLDGEVQIWMQQSVSAACLGRLWLSAIRSAVSWPF